MILILKLRSTPRASSKNFLTLEYAGDDLASRY